VIVFNERFERPISRLVATAVGNTLLLKTVNMSPAAKPTEYSRGQAILISSDVSPPKHMIEKDDTKGSSKFYAVNLQN
jgi:hypothetical protein